MNSLTRLDSPGRAFFSLPNRPELLRRHLSDIFVLWLGPTVSRGRLNGLLLLLLLRLPLLPLPPRPPPLRLLRLLLHPPLPLLLLLRLLLRLPLLRLRPQQPKHQPLLLPLLLLRLPLSHMMFRQSPQRLLRS
jgi:hypothetical protein